MFTKLKLILQPEIRLNDIDFFYFKQKDNVIEIHTRPAVLVTFTLSRLTLRFRTHTAIPFSKVPVPIKFVTMEICVLWRFWQLYTDLNIGDHGYQKGIMIQREKQRKNVGVNHYVFGGGYAQFWKRKKN